MRFAITKADPAPEGGVCEWLTAADGTRFRAANFVPSGTCRGTVVLLNGRTEFIEKYFEVIRDLQGRGYAVATLDWRGQGMSERALGNPHKGHVEDFEFYLSDLHQAISEFIRPGCPGPYRALCHSMGGNIGLRYLERHPDLFESAVFSAPMWGIGKSSSAPGWMRAAAGLANTLGLGAAYVPGGKDYGEADSKFEVNVLTHDIERFHRFVAQIDIEHELRLGAPTLGWAKRAIESIDVIHGPGFAEGIQIPIRVCTAGADALVSVEAQRLVAERLPNAEQIVVEGSRHELLMEVDHYRDQIFAAFDAL